MLKSRSFIAIPPGETIREQLPEHGLSLQEFAASMDIPEEQAGELITGDMQLTPDIAARLEAVLRIPAEFWIRLEDIYRKKIAKVNSEKKECR